MYKFKYNRFMEVFCKHCEIECNYLTENNTCSKLNESNNISGETCIFIPENCEHYGTLFLKLEETKQKIRKYKEEIIYYEAMIASGCKEEKVYKKIIDSLNRFIEKYKSYGSNDW